MLSSLPKALPFTREQFFEVFAVYNSASWPAAVATYALALWAVVLAWQGTPRAGRLTEIVLALMWSWVGVVYQGIFFSRINPVAMVFAGAFLLQAILFAVHATQGRGLQFRPRSHVRTILGAVLIFYSIIAYPLIGLLVGERFPAMPLFGTAPCPLLIFTFGLLVWARSARWWLWIVPLLWSVVGGSAALVLSVPQDWALPISAAATLLLAPLDRPRAATAGGVLCKRFTLRLPRRYGSCPRSCQD